ncbi:thioredoxin-like domain-containing protein [Pontibacter toksunensis]|uniref:Thioredoxin-like domain-containing protein n=1 Tax=Pontibacter toksunensis TaxID=1332631 RepID=A0ABW6BU37_9BACT
MDVLNEKLKLSSLNLNSGTAIPRSLLYNVIAHTEKNHMKYLARLIAIVLILTACSKQEEPRDIFIEGFVKHVPNGKVYLTHAHDSNMILDSTEVENGHFKFRLELDSSFVPFLASIHYRDSTFTENNMIRGISFLNTAQSTSKMKSGISAFFQGRESTTIKADPATPNSPPMWTFHLVTGGKDNMLYQKFLNKGFGNIGSSDSTERSKRLSYFGKVIRQNSGSYFLLSQLYENKVSYTEEELNSLLSYFNKDIRDSRSGKELYSYLANRPGRNKPYPNLLLTNSINEKQRILNPNARINLLVFWASWCGPCRQEIPALKELHQTFKDKGLNLVSISLDRDSVSWRKALAKEDMDWQQYIVGKEQIDVVQQQFHFSGIPFVVLTDNSGREIIKMLGYNENNVRKINAAISKHIASK